MFSFFFCWGPLSSPKWWDENKLTLVLSESWGPLLRLPIMKGLEFSIQGIGERIADSDMTLVREVRIRF